MVQRRRRWTTEQKLALVEEVTRSGASVAGVADRHGLSRSLLFEWRRQVREGTMPGLVRAEADAPPALVPVRVVEEAPPVSTPSPPQRDRPSRSGATVEVVLRNGRVMRVAEEIEPEMLARLAAALDGA